ncbi:MAG: ABC transporter ATP-binding protein [Acidobacteriota bacterium]
MNNILEAHGLGKDYPLPQGILRVFEGIDFTLSQGELVAVMGSSGVGKTTLLNLFGLLDKPSRGKILLESQNVISMSEEEKASIRNQKIGFIFQFYHLLPEFTALENVCFPLLIRGLNRTEAEKQAMKLLKEVSLENRAFQGAPQLSGGEQQRVAIARALINQPSLLLADEPTGNLDWKTGKRILQLIKDLHIRRGLSSIIVTHDEKVARFCQKIYLMEEGQMKLFSLP